MSNNGSETHVTRTVNLPIGLDRKVVDSAKKIEKARGPGTGAYSAEALIVSILAKHFESDQSSSK